jgi:hypothetical protein
MIGSPLVEVLKGDNEGEVEKSFSFIRSVKYYIILALVYSVVIEDEKSEGVL